MLTKLFALLHRGLRHDARLLKVHLTRLGMVLLVVCMLFLAHMQALMVGSPGLTFFNQITWTTLIFATLASTTLFATTITEEKEEQTLPLLALANISPLALIMGKFLPRLVGALLILSVLFPFTLLSITLGGVTWGQVWAAYWTLFAHVILIGALGLFCSVVCRRSSFAVMLAVVGVFAFLSVPKVADVLLSSLMAAGVAVPAGDRLQRFCAASVDTSAIPRVLDIMQTGFDEGAFGVQVLSNLLGAALLFLAAWALFLPFNRLNESDTETSSWFARGARLSRASRRCWRFPVVWKDFHYLVGGAPGWAIRGVLYVGVALVIGFAMNGFQFDFQLRVPVGRALMATTAATAALELLLSACYLFPAEIRQGTWPGLATLPVSIARVAYGKVSGAFLGLVPAAVCFVAGGVLITDSLFEQMFRWDGWVGFVALIVVPNAIWYAVFLHLVVLYSIVLNQWAAVPMAVLTLFAAGCFTGGWAFIIPAMSIAAAQSPGFAEALMMLVFNGVFGIVAAAICFGLQVMIAQRLRVLAGN